MSHERIRRNNQGKERTAGTKTPRRACIWHIQVMAARPETGQRGR